MGGSKLYIFPCLILLTGILSGCLEEIQDDTGNLVSSMDKMVSHTGKIANTTGDMATSMADLEKSTDESLKNIDTRLEEGMDEVKKLSGKFDKGLTSVDKMASSFKNFEEQFVVIATYMEQMSKDVGKVSKSFQQFSNLNLEEIMKTMGMIRNDHKDDEGHKDFFDVPLL